MRHAIARYLFIAGVVASLGLAACSTNGGTPLTVGSYPNGVGGTNGVPVSTTSTNAPVVNSSTTPAPTPSPAKT